MNPRDVYKKNRQASWTRIDMLLELYRASIRHTENAEQLMMSGNEVESNAHTLRAVRIVGGIKCGLDLSRGDLPRRIDQLLDYVLDCLGSRSTNRLASARRVLELLGQAFEEIRPEAIELEKMGQIPPVGSDAIVQVLA